MLPMPWTKNQHEWLLLECRRFVKIQENRSPRNRQTPASALSYVSLCTHIFPTQWIERGKKFECESLHFVHARQIDFIDEWQKTHWNVMGNSISSFSPIQINSSTNCMHLMVYAFTLNPSIRMQARSQMHFMAWKWIGLLSNAVSLSFDLLYNILYIAQISVSSEWLFRLNISYRWRRGHDGKRLHRNAS